MGRKPNPISPFAYYHEMDIISGEINGLKEVWNILDESLKKTKNKISELEYQRYCYKKKYEGLVMSVEDYAKELARVHNTAGFKRTNNKEVEEDDGRKSGS